VVNDSGHGDRPDYKVYKSRRSPLGSLRGSDGLEGFKDRSRPGQPRRREPRAPRTRRPITPRRAIKWVLVAIGAWLALSLLLFMVSAQLEGGVSDDAKDALSGNGNFLTGATVLVLGSDERKGDSIDATDSGPGRADSIMLVHASLGRVAKLSIPRDTEADIPGHGRTKINAAYSIGGITVDNGSRICAPGFDNFWRGFDLPRGEQELTGRQALGYARVRHNPCAPAENDLARAERQQEVLAGIRGALVSPGTFFRLPWVSWRAPQTIRTDLRGPGLLALAADVATGGSGETRVLRPSCLGCGVDASLQVPQDERARAVDELLGR